MDARQKYLEENDYHLSDQFSQAIQSMNMELAGMLGDAIDNTIYQIGYDEMEFCDWGIRVEYLGQMVYFSLRIARADSNDVLFDNLKRITLDEYLDLINLNRHLDEHIISYS